MKKSERIRKRDLFSVLLFSLLPSHEPFKSFPPCVLLMLDLFAQITSGMPCNNRKLK